MKFGDKPGSRDVQSGSFEREHGLIHKLLCRECDAKIGKREGYARGSYTATHPVQRFES